MEGFQFGFMYVFNTFRLFLLNIKATEIWAALKKANDSIEEEFASLSKLAEANTPEYEQVFAVLAALTVGDWPYESHEICQILFRIHCCFQNIRQLFQNLSQTANIPIEPSSQKRLLDDCLQCPGVLAAGLPGGMHCFCF